MTAVSETPSLPSPTLAEQLSVRPGEGEDVFEGAVERYGALGVYGGHFVGQALAAGLATVDESKLAHSLHAYFLRAGDPSEGVLRYEVTRVKESRGAEIRTIVCRQDERIAFHMTASFKQPEEGDTHQIAMPDVEAADVWIAAREARGEAAHAFPVVQGGRAEMEWASRSFRDADPDGPRVLRNWMRVPGGGGMTARERQTVLAFLSDGTLMFNSVLPHGQAFETHRLTSLDHSAWFHHVPDPSEWMLFDQRSTAAGDGRGMNHGEIFAADGRLVMSCSQDSMLRRMG